MQPTPKAPEDSSVGYVLLMGILNYQNLATEQRIHSLQLLQQIVANTNEIRRYKSSDKLISRLTANGMMLVFFDDPEAPARCALDTVRAFQQYPQVQLRFGLTSGPVSQVRMNENATTVIGPGVNSAINVMACGEAGHILVSKPLAEYLLTRGGWRDLLHDLGEAEIRPGVHLRLFNLYTKDLGNQNLPQKVLSGMSTSQMPIPVAPGPPRVSGALLQPSAPLPPTSGPLPPPSGPLPQVSGMFAPEQTATQNKVTILYKRNAQPDDQVLKFLESELTRHGYNVFIDQSMQVGVEWATELARQISTSHAVIPLLSPASVLSEMIAYEVQIAHEAAQKNNRPRLLPVRINFEDPLPEQLHNILAPLQYILWKGPQDNAGLTSHLLEALEASAPPKAERLPQEPPGGAVPLDSKFYVERPTDQQFLDAIKRQDSIVLIKGARQMGKTSLLARGLRLARMEGSKVVVTDFQKLNTSTLENIDTLFIALGELIADQLDLEVYPEEVWKPRRAPSINFERYIRREVLEKVEGHLVWAMDEVDRLFTCDYGSEVFGLFRTWHNERANDPDGPWGRLTLAIVYATEAHLFITDQNQSPFNVGTRLELQDFTPAQVAYLNELHGSPLRSPAEVARFYQLMSGLPYLVRRGLHDMVTRNTPLAAFEELADRDEGPFGDHLRRILVLLARDEGLQDVIKGVLRGEPCPNLESFYRLRSAGLMSGDSARDAKLRCQLYANYLRRHLL